MLNYEPVSNMGYSLLVTIVNRGKGSKVLQFARTYGAIEASCLLGRGTIPGKMIGLMGLSEVRKEVAILLVPTAKEETILKELNQTFHFYKTNQGIAFTIPLAGILKLKQEGNIKWLDENIINNDFIAMFLIVDKGRAESLIELSQSKGFYGGTIIKARGTASDLSIVLNMKVQPEKEMILMLTETSRAHKLADLLNEELKLNHANTGILIMTKVTRAIGLFQNRGGNK